MKLSRLKRAVFTMIAVTDSFALLLVVLLGAGLYAHYRVERSAGLVEPVRQMVAAHRGASRPAPR